MTNHTKTGGTYSNDSFFPNVDPGFILDAVRSKHSSSRHVVVILKDASVSEIRASLKRKTRSGETKGIVKKLKEKQDAFVSSIVVASGGTVVQNYQHALNGVRMMIHEDQVKDMKNHPDVLDILPVRTFRPMNVQSVTTLDVPKIWNALPVGLGLHGEGIKVGIIDTGIDYTHANFGGPGTVGAFNAASATSSLAANASLFGPNAPKVKGGYDFAGDSYTGSNVPIPDPNPLDCKSAGHGSHVAGTAGGFGVKADGTTYTGVYNESTYNTTSFLIGPGVAPKVDLYAYRVFGCTGSTALVVDAIERAVADDMDVINLSLGSPFGYDSDLSADILASNNAVRAGVVVVTAAGNEGPIPYIIGSPATADGAISVAATEIVRVMNMTLNDGKVIPLQLSNDVSSAEGAVYTVINLSDYSSTSGYDETLGCNTADFPTTLFTSCLVVVNRGICARVIKALNGQAVGAAVVVMINNGPGYPPYEGTVSGLNIPFFGVDLSFSHILKEANGTHVTLTSIGLKNKITEFSSSGPRGGDSFLKPEIAAPGKYILSTAAGTGYQGVSYSGTSMATPYVSGVAALVRQAHPTWSALEIKAAIISTANPDGVIGFNPRFAGAGIVNPSAAVRTNSWVSCVHSSEDSGSVAINFGYVEITSKLYSSNRSIIIKNEANVSLSFTVQVGNVIGVPHSIYLNSSLVVDGLQNSSLLINLQVPAATAGNSSGFFDASGVIILTPLGYGNNAIRLSVPYYIVPRSVSSIASSVDHIYETASEYNISVSNTYGPFTAQTVSFFSWGIHGDESISSSYTSVRAVGAIDTPNPDGSTNNPLIRFAVNTYKRWSSPSTVELLLYIDVDPQEMNGIDYVILVADYGSLTTGKFDGVMVSLAVSYRSPGYYTLGSGATFASTDSSVMLFSFPASYLCRSNEPCLSQSNPRFSYFIITVDVLSSTYQSPGRLGWFNPFKSAIIFSSNQLERIDEGNGSSITVQLNQTEWTETPTLGVLIIVADNKAGSDQAIEKIFQKLSSKPTAKPTFLPTKYPTAKASKDSSSNPSSFPIINSISLTSKPTSRPSSKPSALPSRRSSSKPSMDPTRKPSARPSNRKPSNYPLSKPSALPSRRPSSKPSTGPTNKPSARPSNRKPSNYPSRKPSYRPTTRKQSLKPTRRPSRKPTARKPSRKPSSRPTKVSSRRPTKLSPRRPTKIATRKPTKASTRKPTRKPSKFPTRQPTRTPTRKPTLTSYGLTVSIMTDQFPFETSILIVDKTSSVNIGNFSPGTFMSLHSLYSISLNPDKSHCYWVYVSDSFGDGFCCQYGLGWYEVYWNGK